MRKLILIALITLGFVHANEINQKYTNLHAQKRVFKTPQEVHKKHNKKSMEKHHKKVIANKHIKHSEKRYHNKHNRYHSSRYHHDRYHNSRYRNTYGIFDVEPQRGYRYLQRSWFYAYRYGKADFVDRYGFYYGYFNRRGYMFEGEFYRYDRDYRYQDRIRGRGLFDRHIYYRPLPRIYRDEL
jgi:hypothetical protein